MHLMPPVWPFRGSSDPITPQDIIQMISNSPSVIIILSICNNENERTIFEAVSILQKNNILHIFLGLFLADLTTKLMLQIT